MLTVVEVTTKKHIRDFVNLPDKIYKGNPYYVYTIKADEKAMFDTKKNANLKTCIWLPLLAYRDGKCVGRIIGLIQNLYLKKTGENKARFMYFDVLEDFEAAQALFNRVEAWAKGKGATAVHGPLGFNDTDHEGMLVEGFDSIATSISLYNHPYYVDFMDKLDYVKDADWIQVKITMPMSYDDERLVKLRKINDMVLNKYNLKILKFDSDQELIDKYGLKIFDMINITYAPLYGTVPINEEVALQLIKNFRPILTRELIALVEDDKGRLVGFALCFPSIAKALNKSKGRMFPFGIFRLIKAIKKYDVVDLGLVGVLPEYQTTGLNTVLMMEICETLFKRNIKYMESNLMLEENLKIQSQLRGLKTEQHKRNRSFIKYI